MAVYLFACWSADGAFRLCLFRDSEFGRLGMVLVERGKGCCCRAVEEGTDGGEMSDVEEESVEGGAAGCQDLAGGFNDGRSVSTAL